MKHTLQLIPVFLLAALPAVPCAAAAAKPVKVFILAGQSNMEGAGQIKADPKRDGGKGSLEFLVKDAATAKRFAPLVDAAGQWRTRDDVWISYLDRKGPLTVGFGARAGETIGPELGFGWHQGWNDRVNDKFNAEYKTNMVHFIRDIRKDLGAPALPFVIAETGMGGPEETLPRALSLMKAQSAAAEHKEFKGNVAFVSTRAFWHPKEQSPSGQNYHWNSNAETYHLIGEAMGEAMKRLLGAK
jgi:hypothetical protein